MTRIISGLWRGKQIRAPRNLTARPTTDLAKESLFNILDNRLEWEEITALDLFAGTGSLSYEMLSRGCHRVIAVDIARASIGFIEQTRSILQAQGRLRAYQSEALSFLRKDHRDYDLILADPPYDYPPEDYGKLVEIVFQHGLLHPEGMLIIEHNARTALTEMPYFQSSRRYGKVGFSFFYREGME